MAKKIFMGLAAVLVVAGGVAALSAYEAHVINVTAHIENALYVKQSALEFGTVFPQEYVTKDFQIELSKSFQEQDPMRVTQVNYEINQKPKCICLGDPLEKEECPLGKYAPVSYIDDSCPTDGEGYEAMLSLCPFLSKLPLDDDGDTGEPSYYDKATNTCPKVTPIQAVGSLNFRAGDYMDSWQVDLKVPPVDGYVGQDWPAGCPTVSEDSQDYGCDLWIEVTAIGNPA